MSARTASTSLAKRALRSARGRLIRGSDAPASAPHPWVQPMLDVTRPRMERTASLVVVAAGDSPIATALIAHGYQDVRVVAPARLAAVAAAAPDDSISLVVTDRPLDLTAEQWDELIRAASAVAQPAGDSAEALTSRGMTSWDTAGTSSRVEIFRRMDRQSTLHAFWRQPAPVGNVPQTYIAQVGRSKALHELIKDLPKDARILEVGCNVGRNLAYLHDQGYHNLQGIEINQHAVDLLRETYPQLADVPIHVGPAGEQLPLLPDDSLDLVFTMAVIEHIHPDEAHIFDEMVRTSREVLTIEPDGRLTHRQYPHNVQEIFTGRGLRLVRQARMSQFPEWGDGRSGMHEFAAHRFTRTQ
ncbi:class I SAM-dependent methyltransferase [Calidifontibacter sp. DB0510]|uniref:Class I SAM-dependent methyltransferase n=1 Tax=Metallococcus carri TaxID=1656884 RepID=A0A967B4A4_9MICO|nr:class I SAM-dependent methyltransferase [Metallococcus carri]NHN55362.1 class I SAM-dependent methyltransferase [Metallococcus carri]NOP36439.1 class I SAM-dependent methyltransferase [Calidifontibacter sp. DB2511S]